MQSAYHKLRRLQGHAYEQQRDVLLQKLQHWILHSDPGSDFRAQLKQALQQYLGNASEFSLFVRSDTNMEDLPGFTGAGLNLTVPNVQGFENLVTAIKRVWASPFTERAFAWRQQRMQQPQHVYVSVLLMPSVAVEKSGVMVTTDITNDEPGWVTIAVNEGVGGAVGGEAAEELRLNVASGKVQLLAEATAPLRRVLKEDGGVAFIPVSGNAAVLTQAELRQLRQFAETLPRRYPMVDDQGHVTAEDVEFGFNKGKLVLFQARPYLASRRAMQNQYLRDLDKGLRATADQRVNLEAVPLE
jgi:phosphoenolpyruvate synthase/pyruvate phosphate dikinase